LKLDGMDRSLSNECIELAMLDSVSTRRRRTRGWK
jgi:hypothetical protein